MTPDQSKIEQAKARLMLSIDLTEVNKYIAADICTVLAELERLQRIALAADYAIGYRGTASEDEFMGKLSDALADSGGKTATEGQ